MEGHRPKTVYSCGWLPAPNFRHWGAPQAHDRAMSGFLPYNRLVKMKAKTLLTEPRGAHGRLVDLPGQRETCRRNP